MNSINRTIIVEADSRYLTQRVLEMIASYDEALNTLGSIEQARDDARAAAGDAREAADAAEAALADVAGATLFAANIPGLQSDTAASYPNGTLFVTRQEGAVMRVLDPSDTRPHLVTAGGVKLAVERWDRDDRGALAQIGRRAQAGEAIRIACYGDSTVFGPPADGLHRWPEYLGVVLRIMTGSASIATYNCGVSNTKVINWWAFDNFAALVTTPYPLSKYVMIDFGLNDIKFDGAPGWDAALFKARYLYLINQVRLSGRIPILMTPLLISGTPIRDNKLMQGQLLNTVREIAEAAKVDLVDFNRCMQDWQQHRRDQLRIAEYQTDGTHGSNELYVILAGYVAREIFRHRVIDVSHGSRLGPHNAAFSSDVAVTINRNRNNAFGMTAELVSTGDVGSAAAIWVWNDRERKAVYVSPDRSIISGSTAPAVYANWPGTEYNAGVSVAFGDAGTDTTDRPAENHLYVADLPYGLSWLRFRTPGAGTYDFGGWLIVDQFDPASVSAYSTEDSALQLFLPEFSDSRPEVVPRVVGGSSITTLALQGDLPVGWGVVIGTQYLYNDTAGPSTARRKQSIVVQRTATGCDILRVISSTWGVVKSSIKSAGTGAWAGQITIHCDTDGSGNAQIVVRANGTVIARHTNTGSSPFMSPYGRLGGLYRDPSLVTDPEGRQAVATLVPMPM